MPDFVILFRQGRSLTAAELAQRQAEVSAWARAQNDMGRALEPRILAPDALFPGREAGRPDEAAVAAAPAQAANPSGWPVTALLFLHARDLDDAAAVAASHPARHYGVDVEVRPWAPPAVPASPARA